MSEYTGEERRANCGAHSDTIKTVLAAASLMRWILVILPLLLSLVGYNVYVTQQMQVVMMSNFAKIGGQLTTASTKMRAIQHSVDINTGRIDDHEQRLRVLEQRR